MAATLRVALAGPDTGFASSPAPVWGAASTVVLPSGALGANVPTENPGVNITSISCWSAGNCAAVGTYVVQGTPSNFVASLLLMELGHVWQPSVEGIDPGVGQYELPSVSCAAGGTCVAVGSYRTGNATGDFLPDVFTASGGVWSNTGAQLQIPSDKINNGTQQIAKLDSVSCVSAGNCVAVGHYKATHGLGGDTSGMVVTEAGGTWGAGVTISPPGDASETPEVEPSSVSCAPTGQCGAVGTYEPKVGPGSARFSLAGTGGTLAAGATTLPLPSGANSGGNTIDRPSISCGSAGCAATYPYFQGAGGRAGTTFALETKATAGGWAEVPGLGGPSPYTASSQVNAVACAPTACGAVGSASASATGSPAGVTVGWSQSEGGWGTSGQELEPFAGPYLDPFALSCASAGNCTTVGVFNPIAHSATYYGFAASEVDGTWQPAVQLSMAFGAVSIGPDPFFGGVSCPDTGDCAAAGYYRDAEGNQLGFVIDAASGSPTTAPKETGTTPAPPAPPVTPPAPALPHPKIGAAHISGTSLLVPVSCSGAGACSVTLTLTATETLRGSKLLAIAAGSSRRTTHRVVVLGSAHVSIAAGKAVVTKVALNALGKRLLKQRKTLPLTLSVKQAGTVLSKQRLKFRRR